MVDNIVIQTNRCLECLAPNPVIDNRCRKCHRRHVAAARRAKRLPRGVLSNPVVTVPGVRVLRSLPGQLDLFGGEQ